MAKPYIEDRVYQGSDFSQEPLPTAAYEACRFTNCNFAQADLSDIHFANCEFRDCDLSMASLTETAFREVLFFYCKLLGLHFDDCNTFLLEMSFKGCQMDMSTFFQLSLPNVLFEDCSLKEVDFAEADLSKARFLNSDLEGATFENCNLEKADFRSATHYALDPELNRLKKAKFSLTGLAGLLGKYEIEIQ